MRRVTFLLMTLIAVTKIASGQVDMGAVNRPIELLNEANADIENGNYKDAVQKLIAANRLNPKLREVYSSLNTACTHTNQISLLKEYLIKNGEDYELVYAYYLNRGNCYLKQREFEKAIPDYTYSLKLNKESGAIYANRGIAYFSTGKRKEACADWRKAKSLGVTSVNAYINRYCR